MMKQILCMIFISAKRMFDAVNHPNLKVMVDNIATGNAGETLEDWFETFGTDLVHMHFLDGDPYLHNVGEMAIHPWSSN